MLNLFQMRCVARKRGQVPPLTPGRTHCWAVLGSQSPSVPSRAARSSLSLSPRPLSLSHKLHHPETQYLQTTDSHITTLPVPNTRTWSFKGQK